MAGHSKPSRADQYENERQDQQQATRDLWNRFDPWQIWILIANLPGRPCDKNRGELGHDTGGKEYVIGCSNLPPAPVAARRLGISWRRSTILQVPGRSRFRVLWHSALLWNERPDLHFDGLHHLPQQRSCLVFGLLQIATCKTIHFVTLNRQFFLFVIYEL